MKLGILDETAFKKIRDSAPDGGMTYRSYRQLMAWCFHMSGEDSKKLLKSFQEKGLIVLGNKGFKIKGGTNV